MMIAIGSKWQHKDGGLYVVVDKKTPRYEIDGNDIYCNVIWYSDKQGEIYVWTEKHFLDSFKPYEPVKQEFIVIKHGDGDTCEGWFKFVEEFAELKKPMMYKITVEEIF